MTTDFFAYGSLMFEDIMSSVSGSRYECGPALLRDYRRSAIRGEVYPGIRPKKGEVVTGCVYFNLTQTTWQRLDLFEGEMYRRETIEVEFADGHTASAQTYVVQPQFASRLSHSEWSPEEFLRAGKSQFQVRYRGFGMLKPNNGD